MQSNHQLIDFRQASSKELESYLKEEIAFPGRYFIQIKRRAKKLTKDSEQDTESLTELTKYISHIEEAISESVFTPCQKTDAQFGLFLKLPPEIISYILSYLSHIELSQIFLGCKQLKELTEKIPVTNQLLFFPKTDFILNKPANLYKTYGDLYQNNISEEDKQEITRHLEEFIVSRRPTWKTFIVAPKHASSLRHQISAALYTTGAGAIFASLSLFLLSNNLIPFQQNIDKDKRMIYGGAALIFFSILVGISCFTVARKKYEDFQYNKKAESSRKNLHSFFNKKSVETRENLELESVRIDSDSHTGEQVQPPNNR